MHLSSVRNKNHKITKSTFAKASVDAVTKYHKSYIIYSFASWVFPHHPDLFCIGCKVRTLIVSLARDAATGCTDRVALIINHGIELVAAVGRKIINLLTQVLIFLYHSRRTVYRFG